jgi:hypothetical protein
MRQRNRTGDQGKFEVAFPVRTHNQLLLLRVYACEAGCKDRDALFNSVAGPFAACPRPLLIRAVRRRCAVASRQGEEPGTTPGGAGDGAGDGREARIGRALPVKAIGRDGDGVALAVIVANEHRAGFELAPGRAAVACQTLQEPQAFPIEAAEGLADGARQE